MKLRKLMTFLLLFTMLLGTLPLYAIAAEGEATEPAANEALQNGINITIEEDLTVKYHAVSGDKAVFTIEGKEPVEVSAEAEPDAEGRNVFAFDGIGPHQINEAIQIVIYSGEEPVATKDAFTITGYCGTLLTTYPDDAKLAALVADLLAYGKAADAYITKAESDITVTGTPSTVTPTDDDDNMVTNGNTNALYIASAGVRFDYINRLYFKIASADGNFTAAIDGNTYQASELDTIDGYYVVYSDAIAPTEYDTVKTLTVTEGEKTVTIDYSANSYAYRMQNDEEMSNLALALYRFGKSCVAYGTTSTPEIYGITYNVDDDVTLPAEASATYTSAEGATLPEATKDGYAFAGWYTDEACTAGTRLYKIAAGEAGDKVLYAKWCEVVWGEDYENITPAIEDRSYPTYNGAEYQTNKYTYSVKDGDGNKYLEITRKTTGSSLMLKETQKSLLNCSEDEVSVEINIKKDSSADLLGLTLRFLNSASAAKSFMKVTDSGVVQLYNGSGWESTSLTVGDTEFTKIRISINLTNGAVALYDGEGKVLASTTNSNMIKSNHAEKGSLYIYSNANSVGRIVLLDDIRVTNGNIFAN